MAFLICADARKIPLPDGSVQCCVTSPPYWGLRKYAGEQELVWSGAADCAHEWADKNKAKEIRQSCAYGRGHAYTTIESVTWQEGTCGKCGAWRGAYGLEPTVEMYVAHTVEVLREVRRVLRKDGVLFWNLGDSYNNRTKVRETSHQPALNDFEDDNWAERAAKGGVRMSTSSGHLKEKDLCLIPQRVALAAQADGWWLRSDIIWAKPNPMPESCGDRPTDAYEHILMLTKSARYFWDAIAVAEPSSTDDIRRPYTSEGAWQMDGRPPEQRHGGKPRGGASAFRGQGHFRDGANGRDMKEVGAGHTRNLRNVWTFPTQPYSGAHFATFPEELPRRCILAATSAYGGCRFCGAPWERIVRNENRKEKIENSRAPESWKGSAFDTGKTAEHQGQRMQMRSGKNEQSGDRTKEGFNARWDEKESSGVDSQTVGWRPGCECKGQHGRTVACVVLDPFGGSGTTAQVASELNRRCVAMDMAFKEQYKIWLDFKLHEELYERVDYAPLARKRTSNIQPGLLGLG